MIITIILAIIAGASIVISRTINSNLATRIGLFEGTFFNYIVGLIFSLLFFLLSGDFLKLSIYAFKPLPFWAYLGGLVGVIVVAVSSLVAPKISAFYLTLFIFIGQLFTGIIIDFWSLGIMSIGKIIGGILVFIGLTYNLAIDKKQCDKG